MTQKREKKNELRRFCMVLLGIWLGILACVLTVGAKAETPGDMYDGACTHVWGEWIPEIPATYTQEGVAGHAHCDLCGANKAEDGTILDTLTIPKLTSTVTFRALGKVVAVEPYVYGESGVTLPEVPQALAYDGAWPAFELSGGHTVVTARYTPQVWEVTFCADGSALAVRNYTIADASYDIPAVPTRDGLVGSWHLVSAEDRKAVVDAVYTEDFAAAHSGHSFVTVNGVRACLDCRVLCQGLLPTGDGETFYYVNGRPYAAGLMLNTDQTGYLFVDATGRMVHDCEIPLTEDDTHGWLKAGTYRFNEKGEMVIEEYTVHFIVDGVEVAVRTYNEGNPHIDEPDVPHKLGYSGVWEPYTLSSSDVVVNAVYSFNYFIPDEKAANNYIDPTLSFELQTVYSKWTVAEIYTAWDDLGRRFPNYITKTVADYKDGSGIYDLVRYVLEPENGYEKTVYFQAGADSSEHAAQMAALRIAQILCADDGSDEIIHYLRTKVRFVIIPLANPYGLGGSDGEGSGATGLCTYMGIRMNRNFDGCWSKVNVTSLSPMNTGAAPFHGHAYDENGELVIVPETWWIKETIEWIGVDNLQYGFDFHDAGSTKLFGDYWMNFSIFNWKQALNVRNLIRYLCTIHLLEDPSLLHCSDSLTSGSFANWMTKTLGVPGSTIESCYDDATFDREFMNNILETYFNAVIVHTLEDYKRPLDIDDQSADFKLNWYSALGEKYFNWGVTNQFNTDSQMIEAFNEMVEAGVLTSTPFSAIDDSYPNHCYYTYEPEGWTKTIVLYGGYTKTGNTIRPVNGLYYKLLLLATGNYSNEYLEKLGSEYRIIIIPYINASPTVNNNSYMERFGALISSSAAWKTLNGILENIRADGEIDLFLYCWDKSAPIKGSSVSWDDYVNTTVASCYGANANGVTTEHWVCAGEISDDVCRLTERLSYGSNVYYEIMDSSGRIADELVRKGAAKTAVCIESTIDYLEYRRVINEFPVSTGGSNGNNPIDATAFESLNSETARRLNSLINLIEALS